MGDKVIVFVPDSHKKLLMTWKGPYFVKSQIGNYCYEIDMDGKT